MFIAHFLGEGIRQQQAQGINLSLMRNILMVIGIFEIVIIHLLRKFMLPKNPEGSTVRVEDSPSIPGTAGVIAKYTTTTVITLALAESIGIYGLVLFFLGDGFQTLYLFMAVSAVVMFYYRPKKHELESLMGKGPYIS